MMPQPGFAGVTVCLWRDQPPGVSDPDSLRMAVLSEPAMVTMSTSCIVKDKVDRSHLHGHCDHLDGVGDPQQPQTGDLSLEAYNTGHHRPHLRCKQITTFGGEVN